MQNQDQQELPTTLEQALHQLSVERAAGRIREKVLAMRRTEDLRNVVAALFQELVALGIETPSCNINFFDEEICLTRGYSALEDPRQYGISWMPPNGRELAPGVVGGYIEESLAEWPQHIIEEWRAGRVVSDTRIMKEDNFTKKRLEENPDLERYPGFTGTWIVTNVPFTHGIVGFCERIHREEHIPIVQALTDALSLGYARFSDFKRIEEAQQQLIDELEEELQTAHDMQMRLMPVESPQIPQLDIAGRCLTANHVGGDFFQYFQNDGQLSLCMADVTGHAMEAAIPVVMFSGILESQIELAEDLDALFARLNRTLCKTLDDRTFVCFTMADMNLASRTLTLANGGCPYPYHYRAATGDIAELQVEAYPLGIRPDTAYPSIEVQLDPSDRLVLCSDGIVEAANATDELFGFERVAATVRQGCIDDLSSEDLLQYLLAEVEQFTGDIPRADDQTVVILTVQK